MGNINIEIPEDLHDDLRKMSVDEKKDIQEIVKDALRNEVQTHETRQH